MLWSPEQIAGWLKHTYPCDESLHVSHETIYGSLFIQARGALKKELLAHLRRTRGMRRSGHYTQKTAIHGQIVDAVSISERPASVEDRAVPGHWEGDLFFGSGNSQIATLVERQTRYVMLVKLEGKDSQTVVNALIKNARKLPQELYKSLTWLLRQYMPKGIDISSYSQTQLNAIARQLNERPRKTLGFHTPAEMFSESVALTG
jgi:IS30 family transposase